MISLIQAYLVVGMILSIIVTVAFIFLLFGIGYYFFSKGGYYR